jgi:heme exporter protein A
VAESTPDPWAIEASGLGRRYGRRWALADVSLTVRRGVRLMVTGRNGSGKSTLLRVLATAARADRGTARVAGFDTRTARDEVRRRVALLDHHSGLYEALTARQNLQVTAGFLGAEAAARVPGLLRTVGLADRADDPVSAFSAGMRKRLSLARALLQEAEVYLLDEPYGELDPPGFRLLDAALDELKARDATVLLASHLLEHGRERCDEAIVLEEGRLAWSGRAADLPGAGTLA